MVTDKVLRTYCSILAVEVYKGPWKLMPFGVCSPVVGLKLASFRSTAKLRSPADPSPVTILGKI